jgi:hypothetical protein
MPQFTAHFDGKNLCPDEPISLPQGVKLQVTGGDAHLLVLVVKPFSTGAGPAGTKNSLLLLSVKNSNRSHLA